MIYLKKRIKKE